MIKELVNKNDPILRTPCQKFDFTNFQMNPVELYNDLAESLLHYKGLGLAANQIGYPYRAFVIWSDPIKIFINPYIIDQSEEIEELEEACLTFPGIYAKVTRYKVIKVRYSDPYGEVKTEKYQDLTARVIQHEMEHLDGKIFTQNLSKLQLEMAIKRAKKQFDRTYTVKDLI